MKLLALSGSLRKKSYNTAAIEALKSITPNGIEITIGCIGDLPLFNPDREDEDIQSLTRLKQQIRESSGLIISSPEYAHGISGPLNNALDWLVSGFEFPEMPVMLINTSPRASIAVDALKEVLFTMSGKIIEEAYTAVPLLGTNLNSKGIVNNEELSERLLSGLNVFLRKIASV